MFHFIPLLKRGNYFEAFLQYCSIIIALYIIITVNSVLSSYGMHKKNKKIFVYNKTEKQTESSIVLSFNIHSTVYLYIILCTEWGKKKKTFYAGIRRSYFMMLPAKYKAPLLERKRDNFYFYVSRV